MSEWGIALIAAGSAILGSSVTGFFAWKAGHRQAAAAEAAGQAQAEALMTTVQVTLDEQYRARMAGHRRVAYIEFLEAVAELDLEQSDENGKRALRSLNVISLEGPGRVFQAAKEYANSAAGQAQPNEVEEKRQAYIAAARYALTEP
ncbi:hypothetical protein [Streptomyces sp. NPDC015130]|uniref:hypothetical protein n=1 Tax=Streptomyces sp. NPDC015130 TaxID=3364940 RepID=UPI00370086EF